MKGQDERIYQSDLLFYSLFDHSYELETKYELDFNNGKFMFAVDLNNHKDYRCIVFDVNTEKMEYVSDFEAYRTKLPYDYKNYSNIEGISRVLSYRDRLYFSSNRYIKNEGYEITAGFMDNHCIHIRTRLK